MKLFCLVMVSSAYIALVASCDSSPQPAMTATPAEVPTAPSAVPSATPSRAPSAPTETPCTTPAVTGQLNLLPLPGSVRAPAGMTMFQGRLYVAGARSNNVGVIENGQLSRVFATGGGPSELVSDEAMGRLFVLNSGELSVSLSDGQKVQATIPISNTELAQLHQEVREMVIDTQRHRLYVGLHTSRPEIVAIDTNAFTISERIVFTGSHGMSGMALDAANNRLFFGYDDPQSSFNISVLDLQSRQITRKIRAVRGPFGKLLYDAASQRLYTEYYDSKLADRIAVIEHDQQVASLPSASGPTDWLILNQRIYMTNVFSNTVDVVDLQSGQPVASIAVGLYPAALLADPGGERIYVTVKGAINSSPESNRIEVIDTRSNGMSGLIPLAATTPQIIGDATRQRLYALSPATSEVLISDGRRILSRVQLERAPFQMALDERTGRLYVGDYLEGIVSVIDVNSGLVVARVTPTLTSDASGVPAFMYALAVDQLRGRLLVNNTFVPLDQLRVGGSYIVTGTPIGETTWPVHWLASSVLPRYYAVSGSGLKRQHIVLAYDSETLKYQDSGIDDVPALALDDDAQRLYAASTTITPNTLHVLDPATLSRIAQLSLPGRVSAMTLNAKTHHLFLAYQGITDHPSAADNTVEILDWRTLGHVASFQVAEEPSAMAVLGDNIYIASNTDTNLTVVRDCTLPAPPQPTTTPLPAPSPGATRTPFPTLSAVGPGVSMHRDEVLGVSVEFPSEWKVVKPQYLGPDYGFSLVDSEERLMLSVSWLYAVTDAVLDETIQKTLKAYPGVPIQQGDIKIDGKTAKVLFPMPGMTENSYVFFTAHGRLYRVIYGQESIDAQGRAVLGSLHLFQPSKDLDSLHLPSEKDNVSSTPPPNSH